MSSKSSINTKKPYHPSMLKNLSKSFISAKTLSKCCINLKQLIKAWHRCKNPYQSSTSMPKTLSKLHIGANNLLKVTPWCQKPYQNHPSMLKPLSKAPINAKNLRKSSTSIPKTLSKSHIKAKFFIKAAHQLVLGKFGLKLIQIRFELNPKLSLQFRFGKSWLKPNGSVSSLGGPNQSEMVSN
jgi:hypothetical protein